MELVGHFDEGECFAVKSLGSGYTHYMVVHVLPQGQTRMCVSAVGATKSFGPTMRVYPLSQKGFLKEERDEELARKDRINNAPVKEATHHRGDIDPWS